MLTITSETLTLWLSQGFYPFIRLLALFGTAPFFNEKQSITKARIILAFFVILIVSPQLPIVNIPLFSAMGLWVIVQQIVIGIAIGLTMQMAFAAVRHAGEVIGLQMGLSFATFFDPTGGPNMPILGRILNLIMLLLFLSFDGHLWLIYIVINSFELIPIQVSPLNRDGFWSLVQFANSIFINGLMLALPFITLFLILNLALGILNRMTPQLSVFVVGFPLTLTIGISMLGLIISILPRYSERLIHQAFEQLSLMFGLFVG
ncbi:flagellar type III secretion system protein FliR [Providencia stuartii]|uniref:Flagellar biosynthetic protein FliR n=1 Tax=Providencia manganoxydans TaxID=2923283 RepID=A0ABX7ABP8_9GAMM|nr:MULTISPECIES: flagellar biosynthetic protein FliR [Providencia]MDV5225104.1 flagellar biosynthetic protein FliR [Providencia rettgeri]ELR5299201.1 flagellar type III secretion system protein FliR [Providencia stuartii]MDW7587345.1 flagellar biosynthetic protein FliR [Providencia sp. 2023EL-00965]MDX4947271.1 flagellar biosynthetic protein FliR [Providencia manganoxydans]QQO61155.1 flagellar type III secretion system protein FliR [Providencia manganoxydans]